MTTNLPRRRRIRLGAPTYAGSGGICSVTIAVLDRRPVFATQDIATAAVETLRTLACKRDVPIYAYCVMPDHVHLLLAASAGCDIITFVGQFKNLAQRAAWQLGVVGAFWQKSFWDHFLRQEEKLDSVIRYVLDNPVRAGIVSDWRVYPHSGSFVFDARRDDWAT